MKMTGEERRMYIVNALSTREKPISGSAFAKELHVSRQVIVQDIALLRAGGTDIFSTNRGYVLQKKHTVTRVFKEKHTNEEVEEELQIIVDLGGKVNDTFISHKVYGLIRVPMNIRSRRDIQNYLSQITGGTSKALSTITSGYHYHTVEAESEEILDLIQQKLAERGFLAKLQDYEPVDFWGTMKNENEGSGEDKKHAKNR